MSFILDALKKSEAERQQQASREFSSLPTAAASAAPRRWIWALGALLLLNILALIALATRGKDRDRLTTIADEAAAEAPVVAAAPDFTARPRETGTAAAHSEAEARSAASAASLPAAALPTLTELRLNEGVALPDMNLDIHVYGASPADRFVFIDRQKLAEGDRLENGARVEEIGPDGVIMRYRGTRFVLPRE